MLLPYGGRGWQGAWSSRAGELSSMGVRALQVEGSWGEALGATSTVSAAIEWFSGECRHRKWQATFQGGERKRQQDAGARNVVTRPFTRMGMVVVHIWTILNHRFFLNVCVWKKKLTLSRENFSQSKSKCAKGARNSYMITILILHPCTIGVQDHFDWSSNAYKSLLHTTILVYHAFIWFFHCFKGRQTL